MCVCGALGDVCCVDVCFFLLLSVFMLVCVVCVVIVCLCFV